MQTFREQVIGEGSCVGRLGPKEWRNGLLFTQNLVVEELEFIDCEFVGLGLTTCGKPEHRSTARNVRIRNGRMNSFFGTGAIFDDVLVEGLKTSVSPAIFSGCAFRHVVLRGVCGAFLINCQVDYDNPQRNEAFAQANREFYSTVDWALDIRDLQASCFELRGSVPVDLIRRNPEEHFIISRDAALSDGWKDCEPFDSFQISISTFLDSGADADLLVAARRSKHFKRDLAYYQRLRVAGIAS